MSVQEVGENVEIPRISSVDLPPDKFHREYFLKARPVIITGATDSWPARSWTIPGLMERIGNNEVWVRGKTNLEDYRVGKAYTIRRDTFGSYCSDLLKGNAKARSSYLAVASLAQAFPELIPDVPLPEHLTENGKLHLGPYMWVALKGHYEFCHFDPDDNFLIMIQGRKTVRLFGYDIENLYPNPLGSHGKTVQSQVNVVTPDMEKFPNFANAKCEHCVLSPGEMLFIPAFYWHQVTALDTGISLNTFYGDGSPNGFIDKILKPPYQPHFEYWILNIINQNLKCESMNRMLPRMNEVLFHFLVKQWHDEASAEQIGKIIQVVLKHLKLEELPPKIESDTSRFPPVLKIRGLLHRDGNKN